MNHKYLNSVNYVKLLKNKFFIGEVDPWRISDEGEPYFALLVPFDTAYEECIAESNQDITKSQLRDYLKLNNIWIIRNPDEFKQVREEREKERQEAKSERKKKHTRQISEEERKRRSEMMKNINKAKTTDLPSNSSLR